MVADLEDVGLHVRGDFLFGEGLGVAGEKKGAAAVAQAENEGIVVEVVIALAVWRENSRRRAVLVREERGPGPDDIGRRTAAFDSGEEVFVGRGRGHGVRDIHRANGKAREHLRHTADVVGMRMRRDDVVELRDAEGLQVCDDAVAVLGLARVDEQGLAARQLNELRVALSNIEEMDGEHGLRRVAGRGVDRDGVFSAVPADAKVQRRADVAELEVIVVVDIPGAEGERPAVQRHGGA